MKYTEIITVKRFRQLGFSLIETVVGVAILAVVGLVMINAIDSSNKGETILQEKVNATNLITACLEGIRQEPYSDSVNAYSDVVDGIEIPGGYSIDLSVMYSPDATNWYSDNNSGAYKLQRISVSVYQAAGKQILSTCTFRTTRVAQ